MTDEFNNELLSALLDGELSPEEADRVRTQIDQAPELQTELADLKSLGSLLADAASAPAVEAPAQLAESVMAGLTPKTTPVVTKSRSRWKMWSGAGAMVAGAAALMVMLQITGPDQPARNVTVSESVDSAMVALATPADEAKMAPMAAGAAESADMVRLEETETVAFDATEVFQIETESRNPKEVLSRFLKTMKLAAESDQATEDGTMYVVELGEAELQRLMNETSLLDHGLSMRREESRSELRQRLVAMLELDGVANEKLAGTEAPLDSASSAEAGMGAPALPATRSLAPPAAPPAPSARRSRTAAKTDRESVQEPRRKVAVKVAPSSAEQLNQRPQKAFAVNALSKVRKKVRVIFFLKNVAETPTEACEGPA